MKPSNQYTAGHNTLPALKDLGVTKNESIANLPEEDFENHIKEVKRRRIGEFSKELPRNEHRLNQAHHDDKPTKTSILKKAGIKNPQRYESIANLPELRLFCLELESVIQRIS